LEHVQKHFTPLSPVYRHEKTVGLRSPRGGFREVGVEPEDILLQLGDEVVPTEPPFSIPDLRRAFAVGTRNIVVEQSKGESPVTKPGKRVRIRLHIRDCRGHAGPEPPPPVAR
jgi:hypothetical protein